MLSPAKPGSLHPRRTAPARGQRVLAVPILVLLSVSACADTIQTKDGLRIVGRVDAETDEEVRVRTKYGVLRVPKADITRHERDTYTVALKTGGRVEGHIVGETGTELTLEVDGARRAVPMADVKRIVEKEAPRRPAPTLQLTARQIQALHARAMRFMYQKQYDRALADYAKIIAARPDDKSALFNTAFVHGMGNRKREALVFLQRAVESGFLNFGHIERCKAFDGLRKEEAYRALMAGKDRYMRTGASAAVTRFRTLLAKRGIDADVYRDHHDEARNFIYLHAKADAEFGIARRVLEEYAEYQWKTLFKNKPGQPLYIILLTREDSAKALGANVRGVFNKASNVLYCAGMPAHQMARANVVVHEFTHALHCGDQAALRQRHPVWLAEGLATLFESSDRRGDAIEPRHSQSLAVIQAAVREGRALPWAAITRMSSAQFLRDHDLAYAQARYMLFHMHARGVLGKFYGAYGKTTTGTGDRRAAEAIKVAFGKPVAKVEREWAKWILKQKIPAIPCLGAHVKTREGRVVVASAPSGSLAHGAGLREGDILSAVDGKPVTKRGNLLDAIEHKDLGQELALTIERSGETLELKTILKDPVRPGDDVEGRAPNSGEGPGP